MKYAFIQHQASHHKITDLCRVLEVKRSCYYDWKARQPNVVPPDELALRRRMKALFDESRNSLGSRRMGRKLRQEDFVIGRFKTRRLMKTLGLVVKRKRRFRVTTDSNHKLPVADNILNRRFSPAAPNRFWGCDITYVWTQQGWLYVAVVIDLYSRRVVGWATHKRMTKALAIRALNLAIATRRPEPGLVVHSDRGSQYASKAYQQLLKRHELVCSMSRKGNCWDNSPVERFFRSLKQEWTGNTAYSNRPAAEADIRRYILTYYNTNRLHSTLGYTTPVDYENALKNVSGIS